MIPLRHDFCPSSDPLEGATWLSVDALVALGRGRRKVLLKITSGVWRSRVVGKGRNGKSMYQVALESLPEDLQRRWLSFHHAAPNTEEIEDPKEQDLDALKAEHRLNDALKRLSIEERAAFLNEARRRAGIVERYIALPEKRAKLSSSGGAGSIPAVASATEPVAERQNPEEKSRTTRSTSSGYEFTPAVFALCEEARCTNEIILKFYKSRQHEVRKGSTLRFARTPRPATLDAWARSYRKEGLLTFLPAPPQTLSAKDGRRATISPKAIEWMNANAASKPHARALYEELKRQAKKHGWEIPSASWVYRKWKALPAIVTTYRRSRKAYTDKFAPYVPRDHSDLESLQILCGDHSQRDVIVRLPDGSLTRPWCSAWQCMRTGLVWGWHLDLSPSSVTIGLAYANGVRTFGAQPIARPDEDFYSYLYTDQGKDYKGHAIGGKTINYGHAAAIEGGLGFLCGQRRVGLIDDLGLKQILARGYNAREKPIERTHRDMSFWEQSMFEAEYCGPDPKNRPDACNDAWDRHQRLLKRVERTGNTPLLNESPFMALDDYRDALAGYFFEYNHAVHERSTLGGARVVPMEEYRRLYTTRYEISESTLALLLMKAEQRMVKKNGVRMFNFSYLHPDLAYYKGQNVEVRYSEDDYSRCFIIPPPTDAIPNPNIIEAQAVIAGTIRRPNKQTQMLISTQKKHEAKIIREVQLINYSMIRGESVEDRVAAQLEPEVEEEAQVAIAVGAEAAGSGFAPPPARVHLVGRLDRKRVGGPKAIRPVTVDQVKDTPVDDSIFEEPSSGVVKMWEDDE